MRERRPDWLVVARWEVYRSLRRRDFVISILITPVLTLAVSLLVTLFEHKGDRKVAVVRTDAAGVVRVRGPDALPPLRGFAWVDPAEAGADAEALAAAVRARAYEAALIIRAPDVGPWSAELVTRREPPRWTRAFRDHLATEALRERARALGVNSELLAVLSDTIAIRPHPALGAAPGSRRADRFVTVGALLLLVSVLMTSMSYLMVGISGEKQARVTEVVMSAIPAQAWMDGKIIAFTLLGLLTGAIWTASLFLLSGPLAFRVPDSVNIVSLGLTGLFGLLGLYLYNALIAALIASAQNMQSASRWQGNFMLLPLVPVFFLNALIDNPDSVAMKVLSQVPFFSPAMMPARLVRGAAEGWEPALAILLLLASCWLMRIAAGRVFRLGMLMYGKDMTLVELFRWARVK